MVAASISVALAYALTRAVEVPAKRMLLEILHQHLPRN